MLLVNSQLATLQKKGLAKNLNRLFFVFMEGNTFLSSFRNYQIMRTY